MYIYIYIYTFTYKRLASLQMSHATHLNALHQICKCNSRERLMSRVWVLSKIQKCYSRERQVTHVNAVHQKYKCHSCVTWDSFAYMPWRGITQNESCLTYTRQGQHSWMNAVYRIWAWPDAFIRVTWLKICMSVTWLIYSCDMTQNVYQRALAHLFVWHDSKYVWAWLDSFIGVTGLEMCNMTHWCPSNTHHLWLSNISCPSNIQRMTTAKDAQNDADSLLRATEWRLQRVHMMLQQWVSIILMLTHCFVRHDSKCVTWLVRVHLMYGPSNIWVRHECKRCSCIRHALMY